MIRIKSYWESLRGSLWFIPSIMLVASIALALVFIQLDLLYGSKWLIEQSRIFAFGAEGARGMLTAVAGSMLTVVALTFALTLTAMSYAAGLYTPRIFRNFMRDRGTQFVLGYFVSVFAYCLVVLLTIHGGDELLFVPTLSIITGLLLALGGIIVLIFFIHHISASLQINNIIDNIGDATKKSVDKIFPKNLGEPAGKNERMQTWQAEDNQKWQAIPALSSGYVLNVDTDGLLQYAEENDIILKMEREIGNFAPRGAILMSLTNAESAGALDFTKDDKSIKELNALIDVKPHRTIDQDVAFGMRQIVDIALKALSLGVNDTTTAVSCIHFLADITGEIARRQLPLRVRSKDDKPRVITLAPTFQDYVEIAFDQIRISGTGNVAIFEQLAEAIAFVATCTRDEERRQILRKQIELTAEFADQTLQTQYEKEKFNEKLAKAKSVFEK